MNTPVYDFVRRYATSGTSRLHMPGHKGRGALGCEPLDITEIKGADSLFEADGILAQSERNAAALFGTRHTFYSTEGSSLCVKAMLCLAMQHRGRRTVFAARNAHKSFVHAAALLDLDVQWLWPEDSYQLLRCILTPQALRRALEQADALPAAVYVTSPDYLGNLQPVEALADVCHAFGVPLLVDNAHGAYLHFLSQPIHPIDLGADLCCDSAHKTLPVLTGGAYLHIAPHAFDVSVHGARQAMALFGSTSPSYLILQSLDLCNAYLDGAFRGDLAQAVRRTADTRAFLAARGWDVQDCEPLKIVVRTASCGARGSELAERLRSQGIECEYADPEYLVLMPSAQSPDADFARLERAFPAPPRACPGAPAPAIEPPRRAMRIRDALFAPWEEIPTAQAAGRICAAPTVSCPPAVPVVVSGEVIGADAVDVLQYYGIDTLFVVR